MFSMHTVCRAHIGVSVQKLLTDNRVARAHRHASACILSLSLLCRQRGLVQQAGRDDPGGAALVACIMPHTSLRSLLHGQHGSFPQRLAKYEYRITGCVSSYFAYRCSNLRILQCCHATKSQYFSSYFFVILKICHKILEISKKIKH